MTHTSQPTCSLRTLGLATSLLLISSPSWSQTPGSSGDAQAPIEPAHPEDSPTPGAPESPAAEKPVEKADDSDQIPLLMRRPRAVQPVEDAQPEQDVEGERRAATANASKPAESDKTNDSTPGARDEDDDEREEKNEGDAKTEKRQSGMFLRLAPEYSHIRTPRRFAIETRSTGVAIDSAVSGHFEGDAPGGRVEIGYAVDHGAAGAIVPRLGLAAAALPRETYTTNVLGIDHEFSALPLWWSISPGLEVQVPYRFLGLGMDLGLAGVSSSVDKVEPEGSDPQERMRGGILGRLSFVLRLPTSTMVGAGMYGAVEGFAFFGRDMWGTKASVAFFLEFDGSR